MASVFSLVLAALTISVLVAEGRARGRARYHRSAGGSARSAVVVRLGRWRWPSLIYSGTVTTLALVLPVMVLGYWAVRGVAAGEPLRLLWGAAWNSMYISGLAAVAAALAALPVAILAVRHPSRMASLIERSTYMGFALPGIVVALALVFFGANYAPILYQSIAMLLFAYVILFLPQAVGTVRTSLLQVSPRLEEVARSLGRSPALVWLTVTIPLVRPGLVAGAALVFLTAMKELPATLLLSPIGFQTLATRIWGATADGFFARAASPALLMILVSSVPLIWLLRRDGGMES